MRLSISPEPLFQGSPQGAIICISIFREQERTGFSIENTGVHIPEESIPKLFDAFYRVDQSCVVYHSDKKRKLHSGLRIYDLTFTLMLPQYFLHNVKPQPAAAGSAAS